VRGIVTADLRGAGRFGGFYIQQPRPDHDAATSEGLFVFAPTSSFALQVGDYVQVSGRVSEFQRATDSAPLTQIANPDRMDLCGAATPIKPVTMTLPVANAAEFERVEGMLVRLNQPLTVSGNFTLGRFGDLVVSSQGRLYHPNNHPELTPDAARDLNARSRLMLDDGSNIQNPNPIPYLSAADTSGTRRAGDVVKGSEGILTWAFDTYRLQPTEPLTFEPRNPRPQAAPVVGGALKVASLNVLNYFSTLGQRGANNDAELQRQQDKLVATIVALDADVLGLIEIENDGPLTLRRLVDAVNTRIGAPVYAFRDAGLPGTDAIKVAVIHKPARVAAIGNPFVPSDPDFAVADGLRPPVAQRFAAADNGGGFWFVVNHFKSKGSCPADAGSADADVGQGCWNASRVRQAQALNRWVADLVALSGEADVLLAGDFNAYLKEDPLAALRNAGFESLLERLPPNDRYSYVFDNEAGALDHAFASAKLQGQVSGVAVWHTNADEPPVLDYNLEFKTDDRYAPTVYRASDHDPVVVGLALQPDLPVLAPTLEAQLPVTGIAGQPVVIGAIRALTVNGGAAGLGVDWGDGLGLHAVPLAETVSNVYGSEGAYFVRLRLEQPGYQPAELVTTVRVSPAPVVPAADLYISEYVEGSGFNKALEIHNPNTTAVDLSAYTLRTYFNGNTAAGATLRLAGTLAAGAVLVIHHPSFDATLFTPPPGSISNGSVINFNGDDAITLERDGAGVIDQFGQVGFDPGTAWTVGPVTTVDRTLRRKPAVTRGSVPPAAPASWDVSAEWDVFAQNTSAGLGLR
jgi:predicted extracellular nuclease